MRTWAQRILVHLVSVLIVMPFGWCCWFQVSHAEEPTKQAETCCCCPAKQAEPPAKPSEEKRPAPPTCCCDPQPAALSDDAGVPDAKLSAATIPWADVFDAISADFPLSWPNPPFSQTPPSALRLLHCVWLC
jgi:hypothetical protein